MTYALMNKRAATIMNYVMILGLLVIGMIIISNLSSITFLQAKEVEADTASLFFSDIIDSIEKAAATPADSIYVVTFPGADDFTFTIGDNKVNMNFYKMNINLTSSLIVSNLNIIPNSFTTTGNLSIISKKRNLYVTPNIVCVLDDGVCDPGCIFFDQCDPDCYDPYERDVCISYCVDQNDDSILNDEDMDGICDPDCYDTYRDGGVYDFDCLQSRDGICDPDVHMIIDHYCDFDCVQSNGICDPDCGYYDVDCPHWGNGVCEPFRGENCRNTEIDCNCTDGGPSVCFPDTDVADDWGCI